MALNERLYALVTPFRSQFVGRDEMGPGLEQIIAEIERVLDECAELTPQVADSPPLNPRHGTIRLAVAPWDPLNTGADTWVWYKETDWVAL